LVSEVFLATGFAPRRAGDFFDKRPDRRKPVFSSLFFRGLSREAFALDGLAERRFAAPDLGVGRLRAGAKVAVPCDWLSLWIWRAISSQASKLFWPWSSTVGVQLLWRAHRCTGISRDCWATRENFKYNMRLNRTPGQNRLGFPQAPLTLPHVPHVPHVPSRSITHPVAGELALAGALRFFYRELGGGCPTRFGVRRLVFVRSTNTVHSFDKFDFQ
jgi:hypothetical protein